jgi:Dolichyl-phosphate-mannose-protein mannosyltransferase
MKLLARILADDEDEERMLDEQETAGSVEVDSEPTALHWGWTLALAAGAALPRLFYLFVATDPENPGIGAYGDVWHHWQIAYLTKEIGLSAPTGPRLWDLKGLDYFWGILHPLLMVAVFDVTGSIDIVLDRLTSLVFGVAAIVLLFHICRIYWGNQVAFGAALIATLLPTSVMNDASGMLEPIGVALCLLGIWAWTRRNGFLAGLAFGLATMARAEAWIFSFGMVIAAHLRNQGRQQKAALVAGFAGALLLYMLVLQQRTGNPIYPLWWNFIANAAGAWTTPITANQAAVRPVLGVVLLGAAIGLAWTLWKRPASQMLLTFGFGYWVFAAGMLGFTSFLSTWLWWTPISRRFEFPYVFAGTLLVVVLLRWIPGRIGKRMIPVGWVAIGVGVLASQLLWIPISDVFGPTEVAWHNVQQESIQLGAWYHQAPYAGHAIAVPPDRPDISYGLARFGGVEGKHLVSEMYDPFAYLPSGYQYQDHQSNVATLVECWLADTDIRLMAIPENDANLAMLQQLNPSWFVRIGSMDEANWAVWGVSAPQPSAAECKTARSATK